MAFPTVAVEGNSTDDSSDTSGSITLPTGTYTTGDTILAWAASRQNTTVSGESSGWTELFDETIGSDHGGLHAWYRKSDGTESGSTMTYTTSNDTKHPAHVICFSGAADPTVSAPQVPATSVTGSASSIDPPSSTNPWTGEDAAAIVAMFIKVNDTVSAWTSSPASPTNTWDSTSSSGGWACTVSGGVWVDTQRDSIDPGSCTLTGSRPFLCNIFWVRPAVADSSSGGKLMLLGVGG